MAKQLRADIAIWVSNVVVEGQSATRVVQQIEQSSWSSTDRSLAKRCLFGVSRHIERLSWQLSQLLKSPLKPKDHQLNSLLLSGLYQLYWMQVPDHAVLSESVNATRTLGKSWASKLVNGVLRNAQRKTKELNDSSQWPDSARYQLPKWLLKRVQTDWPNNWPMIAEKLAQQAPLILRANQTHSLYKKAEALLDEQQLSHQRHPLVSTAFKLDQPVPVAQVPHFDSGLFSVQDLAAQLAAQLLPLKPQSKVLDACAAPGGKTAHLLEHHYQADINLLAIDNDAHRAEKIRDNLKRLNMQASVKVMDATLIDDRFDAILLDAPCSATGVIRRQPDIKIHRKAEDIAALVEVQNKLLNHLWQCLTPGGYLLYATCSILKAENTQQIEQFLNQHPDASEIKLNQSVRSLGLQADHGLQLLPDEWHDGFYYALLQKN